MCRYVGRTLGIDFDDLKSALKPFGESLEVRFELSARAAGLGEEFDEDRACMVNHLRWKGGVVSVVQHGSRLA